jgi:hypothetical protein
MDPAFAHAFVGQSVNMLEQKKPDHKLCRNSRPATPAHSRRRAQEIRVLAAHVSLATAKAQLLELARDYDALAKRAEEQS